MSTVYVLHLADDLEWVESELLRPLPALGFGRWVSSETLPDRFARIDAMGRSAVVIAVVSAAALASPAFAEEAAAALAGRSSVIPIFVARPDLETTFPALRRMWNLARIEEPDTRGVQLWRQLDELLPPAADLDKVSVPMPWDVEAFSMLLAQAAQRNDQSRLSALVDAFTRYDERPSPYPAAAANHDLDVLRADREFLLMRRYASTAVRPGTTDFRVRRQLAQALIELKDFDAAVELLGRLVEDTAVAVTEDDRNERVEALGLMGRCEKQRYIDAGSDRDDAWLIDAIDSYRSVFDDDPEQLWHGVNTASCILRAHRDGVTAAPPIADALAIAEKVRDILEDRERTAPLDLWDCATRVEAYLDLGDYAAAEESLSRYLTHPDLRPFEVSSTYRQFDEVLQLAMDERGLPLLTRLAEAAGRQRAGGIDDVDAQSRSLLVRVTDPGWSPVDIPDLVIQARLGTVLSVSGTDRTVGALLKDPQVTNVEESRPTARAECNRSMPFVGVADTYTGADGVTFDEDGGEALVAIIDNDIDVLHAAFRGADGEDGAAGKPRIVGIWDQRDPSGPPPAGFRFGTYHSEADVVRYDEQRAVPPALASTAEGHGTHVASIAVGRRSGEFAGGVAPGARLLVVISDGDGPTGYSSSHLAALTFIDQTARTLGKPVVVNVSQGANAGAHDGTSALEAIFDTFTGNGRAHGRVVVKSAGNMRDKGSHAKLTIPPDSADRLRIRCAPRETVKVELWWDSADRYRFRLTAPAGEASDWAAIENPHVKDYVDGHGRYAMNLVRRHIDNGDSLLEVTFRTGYRDSETVWTLDVEAVAVRDQSELHAWIERDELARFDDHQTEEMTLTVPATARTVITVGAVDAEKPVRVGEFSSYGPTRDRREKPDLCAPGIKVSAAASGTGDGVVVMCGTSMAAPHVTGAVALLLSRAARTGEAMPTASQIGKALRQNTMTAGSRWDRGQGYGVLDIASLLRGF